MAFPTAGQFDIMWRSGFDLTMCLRDHSKCQTSVRLLHLRPHARIGDGNESMNGTFCHC